MEYMPISIVMPCCNEGEIIEKVVRAYYNEVILRIEGSEFIIIDDCSRDSTYSILQRLKELLPQLKVFKTPVNGGHGRAVRMGYELATKEYIFQVDSDNQFAAKDFWRLYALRDKYDFISGFRKRRRDPIHRLILAYIIRIIDFILFGVWIKDANCPFRLIKKKTLEDILKFIDMEALAPNIMISILAKKEKINMLEMPIGHYPRTTGSVSVARWGLAKFGIKGLKQLIMLRKSI